MDALNTDDLIPVTDRQWRERWAQELTRAEAAERRAKQALLALEDWHRIAASDAELAEQRIADLRAMLEDQAARAAKAEVDIARRDLDVDALKIAHEESVARSQANFSRADKLAQYIETLWNDEALTPETEHVRALIEEAGVECRECDGRGRSLYDDGSDTDYPMFFDTCETCDGVGKVIR